MGVILRNSNDPPGQRSFYIVPGDRENKSYRLTTFQKYPNADIVRRNVLASSGFFYTGFKDRVKCFSCGVCVERWTEEDDPRDPGWHNRDCLLVNGSRSETFSTRQVVPPTNHRPGSSRVDDVDHVPIPDLNRDLRSASEDSNQNSMFPCQDPINPHMRSELARLQTFNDRIHNWPSNRIQAAPQEMSQAGLYYLGEADRVKCWYCNGGLQNWDRFDDPWFEHAKWFPTCEFVLQQKGPEYVHQVVARFPNINRPEMTNSFPSQAPRERTPAGLVLTSRQISVEGPQIIDPREQIREINNKISADMISSNLVQQARNMGFNDANIRAALRRQYQTHNSSFSTLQSMVEVLLSIDDASDEQAYELYNAPHTHLSVTENIPTSSSSSAVEAMQSELHNLKRSRSCKRCFELAATVVFLPCGHLACCEACAGSVGTCPVCEVKTTDWVKSYVV